MTNSELYNYFLAAKIPSRIAALAADAISLKSDELWLGDTFAVKELAETFIELYSIEGDLSLETLGEMLV